MKYQTSEEGFVRLQTKDIKSFYKYEITKLLDEERKEIEQNLESLLGHGPDVAEIYLHLRNGKTLVLKVPEFLNFLFNLQNDGTKG